MKPSAIDATSPPGPPPARLLPTAPQMAAITINTRSAGSVSVMIGPPLQIPAWCGSPTERDDGRDHSDFRAVDERVSVSLSTCRRCAGLPARRVLFGTHAAESPGLQCVRAEVWMLHEFIATNRDELISRCRAKVATRSVPPATSAEIDHGVPVFLDQLADALRLGMDSSIEIGLSAVQHGHDLLKQ